MLVRVAVALVVFILPAAATAENRVALVIGNDAYQSLSKLANPGLDAGKLANLLEANGFDVHKCDGNRPGCFDLTQVGLLNALDTFRAKAKGKDLALVFFSGHGMQGDEGENVLSPIDSQVDCAENTVRRGVKLDMFLAAAAGAREMIVILDACRNNALSQCTAVRGSVALSFGPLEKPKRESFVLVSSTMPGQVALDGPPGEHSPFARALLHWLSKLPDIYFHQLLLHVAKTVIEETARARFTQVPEMLVRGVAPEACLKGHVCSADPQGAAQRAELEKLKAERASDQLVTQIGSAYLAKVAMRSGKPLSEEEKQRVLAGIKDAGRALINRGDNLGQLALKQLEDGNALEAERIFTEILEAESKTTPERRVKAAEAARHLAALARPRNVIKGAEYYRRATELTPEYAGTWIDYGEAARDAGNIDEAARAFQEAIDRSRGTENVLFHVKANYRLGDIAKARGDLSNSRRLYERALEVADSSVKVNPDDDVQRELSVSYAKVGSALYLQGNLRAAIEAYKAALTRFDSVAKANIGNADRQLDLAVTHSLIGAALLAQGKTAEAFTEFEAYNQILSRLLSADPGNPSWQDEYATSLDRLGNLQLLKGDLAAALENYYASFAIAERLALSDPANAAWQRELSLAHSRMGDVFRAQSNLAAALEVYKASLAIIDPLAKVHPQHTGWQRDLAVAQNKIGDVLVEQAKPQEALDTYTLAFATLSRLAKSEPANANWQRDLSLSYRNIGNVLLLQDNLAGTRDSYHHSFAIAERLAEADPTNAGWQRDLSASYEKSGNALIVSGQVDEGRIAYRKRLVIAERLVNLDPTNAEWQVDLANALFRLALAETVGRANDQNHRMFKRYIDLDLINNPSSISSRVDLVGRLFKLANLPNSRKEDLTRALSILRKPDVASRLNARQRGLIEIVQSSLAVSPSARRGN